MFADGYFSISFEAVLGFAITLVSVWFVVKQLNETRLASQMEGMIALAEIEANKRKDAKALDEFTVLDNWQKLTDEEAYSSIQGTDAYMSGYLGYAEVYGMIGALVRAGALDADVAAAHFGYWLPEAWRRLEKFTMMLRKEHGISFNEQWEWLALEFEKLDISLSKP